MTYKKPKIEVSGTTLMGIEFSGDANAYEALKAHKTIKAKVNDEDALIPFHAVKEFAKSVVAEDAERTDPYCGGGTEPIGDVWFRGTAEECFENENEADLPPTELSDVSTLLANPQDYTVAINGTELQFFSAGESYALWNESLTEPYGSRLEIGNEPELGGDYAGCDITPCIAEGATIEVTVTHK